VVPRAQVRTQLDAQKVASYQNGYDEKTQVELGRALNAGQSVVTRLARLEGGCAVTATLFDIARSATERSASVRCACTAPAFTQAMAALAGQLAGR
jgi:6-phosphogluconate dehydrogenase